MIPFFCLVYGNPSAVSNVSRLVKHIETSVSTDLRLEVTVEAVVQPRYEGASDQQSDAAIV